MNRLSKTLYAIRQFVFGLAILLAAISTVGCVDQAQLVGLRDRAIGIQTELHTELDAMNTRAQDPALAPETRQASARASQQLEARLGQIDSSIEKLDQIIAANQDPESVWNTVSDTVIPILPEPLRSPFLLIGALILATARAAQLKRAAGSIAKGIAKASQKDDEFRSALDRHADTFRTVQTSTAQRIVDEKVKPGFMLRLPI